MRRPIFFVDFICCLWYNIACYRFLRYIGGDDVFTSLFINIIANVLANVVSYFICKQLD